MMQLFAVQSSRLEAGRVEDFLEDHYICAGWPGLGDLEGAGLEEIKERLARVYGLGGGRLVEQSEELLLFNSGMQDGDYILLADDENSRLHLGDLGDYYYVDGADHPEDGTCHRRGVTWLKSAAKEDVSPELRRQLRAVTGKRVVAKLHGSVTESMLERWFTIVPESGGASAGPAVDDGTVMEALAVLKEALRSGDPERRERAAIAILRYASERR
ncbi:hypothetical protein [Paenibacillus sp. NPDC058071]|uniref:hypothetical protein n=1 Tax=Paenibacillus sp. NPDC058071 TaxID=3346326 RepID=UPI0036D8C276